MLLDEYIHEVRAERLATIIVLGLIVLSCVLAAILWPYTINTWLVYFGKKPLFKWYYGLILNFVPYLSKTTIPAAVITWILMLFLD